LLNTSSFDAPAIADGSIALSERSSKEHPWIVIWSVASLYWLFMTATDVMVNWDYAGTELNGHYFPSSGTRMLSYLLECGISACLYQLAFHRKWPSTLAARVLAILYQIVLALVFCVVAAMAMAVAMGTVEGRWWLLQDELAIPQHFEWSSWAWVFGSDCAQVSARGTAHGKTVRCIWQRTTWHALGAAAAPFSVQLDARHHRTG
jgi:hypothetical protein